MCCSSAGPASWSSSAEAAAAATRGPAGRGGRCRLTIRARTPPRAPRPAVGRGPRARRADPDRARRSSSSSQRPERRRDRRRAQRRAVREEWTSAVDRALRVAVVYATTDVVNTGALAATFTRGFARPRSAIRVRRGEGPRALARASRPGGRARSPGNSCCRHPASSRWEWLRRSAAAERKSDSGREGLACAVGHERLASASADNPGIAAAKDFRRRGVDVEHGRGRRARRRKASFAASRAG